MISQLNKNENNEAESQNHQPKQSSFGLFKDILELLGNVLLNGDSLFYFFEIFGGLFKFIIEVSVAIIVAISSIF